MVQFAAHLFLYLWVASKEGDATPAQAQTFRKARGPSRDLALAVGLERFGEVPHMMKADVGRRGGRHKLELENVLSDNPETGKHHNRDDIRRPL